jgi:peptidoglycan/LPS O-acetylase OafA/YrhL
MEGQQKHFEYVDALRGYAILGVMIVHTGQLSSVGLAGATTSFFCGSTAKTWMPGIRRA